MTGSPDHQSHGFSTDCATCHITTAGWRPANFRDHDAEFFPIYGGAHGGAWDACTECHIQEGDFKTFSCTNCHEHNQQEMDQRNEQAAGYSFTSTACLACQEHEGIPGYTYNSESCFPCHPLGTADGAFDHNTTNFPLTGAHQMGNMHQLPGSTSAYISLRYRASRKLSLSASFDRRNNVIYYEPHKSFIDKLIEQETRQGLCFRFNYRPIKFETPGSSIGYRTQENSPNSSRNLYGFLTFRRIL